MQRLSPLAAVIPLVLLLIQGCASAGPNPEQQVKPFITRDGHSLMEGQQRFRFAGILAPELHRIEDGSRGICEADPRGWGQYFKWPTAAEQENWIKALAYSGHKATRVHPLSIATPWDAACERETHVFEPRISGGLPRLNEEAMQVYDRMIALADKHDLRLILPFIDHWEKWGGREQLAAFYGEEGQDLHDINSKTYAAYTHIIKQVLARRNTVTGRLYRDEPAILAWETGNELRDSTEPFVTRTAAFIKQLDPNHLVVDGSSLKVNEFALEDPNVDIISNQFHTENGNNNPEQVMADLQAVGGKKVYMVSELEPQEVEGLRDVLQAVVHADYDGARTAGAFVTEFLGHREEGGFYWHKDDTGHYSYHLPGFEVNDHNNELAVLGTVRSAQAQMNGAKEPPPLPVPEAPVLHPIANPSERIMWLGAPAGRSYRIERAESEDGPWTVLGNDVSDGRNEFDPRADVLFRDPLPRQSGHTYYYRVIAKNESGESPPSNVVVVAPQAGWAKAMGAIAPLDLARGLSSFTVEQ